MRVQLPAEVAAKLNTAATPVTKDSTPAQSYVSGASLLGDSSLAMGPSKADSVGLPATNRNKNTNAQIIGRGLSRIIPSVGAGVTSALDSTADAVSDIAFRYQSALAKQTNSDRDLAAANVARRNYEKANSTHLLGDNVKTWEQTVAEKNAQIVKDNPDSKLAETAYKATQYAQTVGEMLPSVAASALVGGAGIAAMGGKQALALAGTSAAKAAAVSAAGKLGQAVGLGVMAMNVYDKSLDESTALGYDFATSSKKAFGDAALEVGTEMLFGGIAGLGTGVVSQVSKNVVNRSIAKAAASEGAEQLIKMTGVEKAVLSVAKAANRVSAMMGSTAFSRLASNAFGEAAEEMISEFLGPYIERMTTNPNASNASIDQIIEAGIGGAIVSFAMSPLGKLQTMIGTPDADIVEKARLTYKLQDYDQNVRMMKDLIYDAVAGEDLTAVEKQMGRELTKVSGDNVAKGLTSDYQRQAARILNDLEASGHTAVDVSNAWKALGELYSQVSQERADAAAARIHNDVAKNTLISESASVQKAQVAVDEAKAKFDEAVKAYDIAVNRNDGSIDTEAARKARAETERTLKNAQANLEKAIENARRGAELRLSKEDAAEKYGQEAVDNFLASQRVRDIQRGRFYATDANGNERLYTKDQYAAEKFGGNRYSQLTKAQKAEVDAASKAYQDAVTKELEAFAKRVNDAITQRGLGGKLRVELVKPGAHKFDVGYAHNGVIYFTQERVHTTEAADYFLSHEFLHAIEDKFISQEDAAAFHKTIRSAMDTIGFNYDEWFARLAKRYESSYLPRIKSEAKQKGKKGKEFDSYVNQKFVKLVEGEIRARFMQTAFSSQSILQSLAVETPELLERAKQSVNDSSIAELTDTMWDYERLVILDRINKALTAPVSAETNKEKNAEAVESALLALDEDRRNQYNPPTNSGVKNNEAVSNSGANLHDFDGGSERRYTESRGKDGDGALGVGEENQGRVGGSESSQEPRAVEIVSKWLDRGSGETQMLLDSFGSEEAFAKRFLGMYDQSPIVAETWSNFFTDVDAAIEELDRLFGRDSSEMYFEEIEDDGIGMTEERLRQYRELQQKYGENEFGVPNKINSNVATSKFASRLAANKANIWSTDADGNTTMTGVNTPEELAASLRDGFLNGVNTHIVMTDDAAIAEARSRIDRHKEKAYSKDGKVIKETVVKHKTINDAFTYAKGLLTSGKVLNKNDLAFAQQLIVEMTNQYKELNEGSDNVQPIESKNTDELFNQIQELVADTCAAATRAGQNLQAFSLLKKMTPTGRLYYIESQADQLISELVDRRGQSRVSGYFFEKDSKGNVRLDENNKPKRIIISDELRQKMYECTTKEEMNAVEEEIIAEIASKIDPSLMDRVTAWRYLSMLGNPRTHVRNIVSNFTMGTMVKAKNRVGGALEDIFLKDKTQGRTKTLKAIDPELRKSLTDFAENDWAKDGMSDVALSGGKVGFQNRINEARKKMKLDILDKAAKKNSYLLELEDDRAGKRAYKEAFVHYAAANNLTVEYLSAGTVESNVALAQARSYAVNEAAKATYHDASKVASMLNELEHMSGSAGVAAKLLIGGIAPFKKTPINILSRGKDYSPIGLVDGLVKTIKACQSTTEDIFEVDGKKVTRTEYETTYGGKGGKFVKSSDYTGEYSATSSADALDFGKDDSHGKPFERFSADAKRTKAIADALDQMAAGLTGTGLMIVGALLAQLGLMKGSGDDENKDAEYYDQMLGNQEYSITIGNKNYTLDWLTPVSMPLFAGVELHNAKVDGGEMSFEELIDAIGRVADPITNLSFLQGVNDAMSEYDSGLYSFARSAAESFAGQFVPTVFGQVARSIDPTRRTTYAPKDSAAGKKAATFINKMENKIPGLSQKNAAYVDLWGRTETNNGDTFVGRLFMNSVAPMYVRTVNKTEADDYLTQLFSQTGDNSIIPKSPESSYTVSGETFYLTSQEYQQTKELVGQLSHVGVTSLLSVPGFAELSAEDQADLVSDVYSFAKRVAKEDYAYANGIEIPVDSTNTKIKNAVLAGMSIGEAVYVYKMANLVEGEKNSKGNTISGSKKANLLSFYRTMGLTNEQINAIKPSNYDFGL